MAFHCTSNQRIGGDHVWYAVFRHVGWNCIFLTSDWLIPGVWLGGYLYDIYGTYDPVWWFGVVLGLFAAVVHWPIKEQEVEREQIQQPSQ